MNIPYVFKRCSECGEWLVASTYNFHKYKRCKYGLHSKCKKCKKKYHKNNRNKILEQQKQWREDNKDKIKQYYEDNKCKIAEQRKHHYEENRDEILEQNKQYRKKNKDKRAKYDKQYYEDNKDKILEYKKQYRATPQGQITAFNACNKRRLREENQGVGIKGNQWLEMMDYFDWKCAYSGQVLSKSTRSLDHIKPLNRGGEHEVWNLVPMDRGLNSSKNDNNLLEWYQEQDFYSEDRLQKIYEWQEYAFNKWHKEELVK